MKWMESVSYLTEHTHGSETAKEHMQVKPQVLNMPQNLQMSRHEFSVYYNYYVNLTAFNTMYLNILIIILSS